MFADIAAVVSQPVLPPDSLKRSAYEDSYLIGQNARIFTYFWDLSDQLFSISSAIRHAGGQDLEF